MTYNIPEVQDWIKRIIDSCNNPFHFESAQIIIDNFKKNLAEDELQEIALQEYFNKKIKEANAI